MSFVLFDQEPKSQSLAYEACILPIRPHRLIPSEDETGYIVLNQWKPDDPMLLCVPSLLIEINPTDRPTYFSVTWAQVGPDAVYLR